MEVERSCYRSDHFNGGKMVMLQLVSVGRENVHVIEVASLIEGAWLCYRCGQFNGGRMVILQWWTV